MVLNKNDLKKYSVVVEDGSGCLFQSMTDEYTYILTAKHIFFKKVEDGRPEKIQLSNGLAPEFPKFFPKFLSRLL